MKTNFKKSFAKQFILASILFPLTLTHATIHENAEDGKTTGWYIYDKWPSGVKIENIKDKNVGNFIQITGTTSNGVDFLGWKDTNPILQWKMKADKWNVFYVCVMTKKGFRYLTYTPRTSDKGRDLKKQSYKIRLGLGEEMMDGKWHIFTRNIKEDLAKYEPDNTLLYIQGIKIRGAGSYDDIETLSSTKKIIVLKQLKAFPTAEGAGAMASGGRGGQVIYVTNRNTSGEGSLKAALATQGTRTIVFAIGGKFDLTSGITLGDKDGNTRENLYNNFTLAGQTAWDKGGVHLANNGDTSSGGAKLFNIYGQENMILRYFDTRFNWEWYVKDNASDQQPSIRFVNSSDLIIDHMTSGWSAYGLIVTNSFRGSYDRTVNNITVQRSLFHENIINPDATGQKNHNVGLLLGTVGEGGSLEDWNKMGHFSIHKNAFIGVSHRFPNTAGGDNARFDIINNYIHGFDGGGHKRLVRAGGNAHNDFRSNVYQETLYSPHFSPSNLIGFQYGDFIPEGYNPDDETPNFHIDKNLFLSNDEQRLDITDTIQNSNGRDMLHVWTPAAKAHFPNLVLRDTPNSTTQVPVSVLNSVVVKENILNNVGGNIRFNHNGSTYVDNTVDEMYIGWAKNNFADVGSSGMGDSNRFLHPQYNTDAAVNLDVYDTDRDGIPNVWEIKHGLDENVSDGAIAIKGKSWMIGNYTIINDANYTNLEIYLADIAGDFHMLAKDKKK